MGDLLIMDSEGISDREGGGTENQRIKWQKLEPRVLSGAQAIVQALILEGVETIFGYPGGAIMPFYDALFDAKDKIRHVLVRHEQGAAHAAEGYARTSGKVGVCVATSGPGATNLVTGIADAMMDSVPLVCITGQVNSWALGSDAFQETDIIGITIPITKWNYQITSAGEIPEILAKAFCIAKSGRPGPVLVDITKDAMMALLDLDELKVNTFTPRVTSTLSSEDLAEAAALINGARKPYMLIGHGVALSNCAAEVLQLAEKADIPVASTLHGLSAVPTGHSLFVGMLGMHGNYGPNVLANNADVVMGVGLRFDDRVTSDASTYVNKAKIIHIEIDPSQVGKSVKADVAIIADAKQALAALLPMVHEAKHPLWREEFSKCQSVEHDNVISQAVNPHSSLPLHMSEVVNVLSECSAGEALVVADVGQHQMMTARYYKFSRPRSFISSGGLGTMGFALPAAIGAKIANPDREVVAIIGDGGFQMNIQELATIAQEGLGVKVLVLNNSYLGMVRQWQELFFERRYSFVQLKNPDFVGICRAYGIEGRRIAERSELVNGIEALLSAKGPYLLEAVVECEENVFPMVPAGASVQQMRLK